MTVPEERLEMFFPGKLRSKERARAINRGGFARMYTPKETTEAEKEIRDRLVAWKRKQGWIASWNGPVHLRLWCLYKPTKATRPGMEYINMPDADNVVKTFMDAIRDKTVRRTYHGEKKVQYIEGLISDDCRVSSIVVRKLYHEAEGAVLVMEFHLPQNKEVPRWKIPKTLDNGTVARLSLGIELAKAFVEA